MPWSSLEGKWWAAREIRELASRTGRPLLLIDGGAGAGAWHTTVSAALEDISHPHVWHAVEVWVPNIERYDLAARYHHVHCDDLRQFDFTQVRGSWDNNLRIAILGDVLEHMTEEEALAVVANARAGCDVVIVSLPTIRYPQGEIGGNPYERHVKEDWTIEDALSKLSPVRTMKAGRITSTFWLQ